MTKVNSNTAAPGRIRRAKLILREQGLPRLLHQVLLFFQSFLIVKSRYVIYENDLSSPKLPCKVDNLISKVITGPNEFDKLLAEGFSFSEYEMSVQQHRERLDKAAILFCAFVGKELAHASWVATSRKACSDFYPFPMEHECTAYIGGTVTIPKYRRQGINLYIHSKIFWYLKEEGLSRAVLAIQKDNIAAQNSQKKLGSSIWGNGYVLELLRLFIFRWNKPKSGITRPKGAIE